MLCCSCTFCGGYNHFTSQHPHAMQDVELAITMLYQLGEGAAEETLKPGSGALGQLATGQSSPQLPAQLLHDCLLLITFINSSEDFVGIKLVCSTHHLKGLAALESLDLFISFLYDCMNAATFEAWQWSLFFSQQGCNHGITTKIQSSSPPGFVRRPAKLQEMAQHIFYCLQGCLLQRCRHGTTGWWSQPCWKPMCASASKPHLDSSDASSCTTFMSTVSLSPANVLRLATRVHAMILTAVVGLLIYQGSCDGSSSCTRSVDIPGFM